jgi:hypothetical protein
LQFPIRPDPVKEKSQCMAATNFIQALQTGTSIVAPAQKNKFHW